MATTSYDANGNLLIDGHPAGSAEANAAFDRSSNGFKTPWGTVRNVFGPSADQQRLREEQRKQADAASGFADQGQAGYGAMTQEAAQARDYLRRLASGENSVSAEQLRQGNQQNLAAQRSFAASASPQNATMAARTAANNMNRASMGLSGQQAIAGLAERNAAQQGLANMIMQERGQDMNVALGSRQNANAALGAYKPEASTMEKVGAFTPILKLFSDKRLKEDISDADTDANKTLQGLRAYTYKYKDEKFGKGKQLGVMAQELEKVGLKQAVIDTPQGKAVDVGKLAGANTAMLAALGRRVAKIEKGTK